MKKNRRITRNSYKRKIILFGLLLFLSIGLISTGFAAFMMSNNALKESNGMVNVGLVTDANLEFTKIELWKKTIVDESGEPKEIKVTDVSSNLEGFYFSFEPKITDVTGRVHYGETMMGDVVMDGESLTMIVRAAIAPKDVLSEVTIELNLPDGVKKAEERGYIVIPEAAKKPIVFTEGSTKEELKLKPVEGSTTAVSLEYTIEFKWGEAFNGMNPSEYYDLDDAGKLVDSAVAKKNLQLLRAYVYGYSDEAEMIYNQVDVSLTLDQANQEVSNLANQKAEDASFEAKNTYTLTIIATVK